jgi:hypothetical protein
LYRTKGEKMTPDGYGFAAVGTMAVPMAEVYRHLQQRVAELVREALADERAEIAALVESLDVSGETDDWRAAVVAAIRAR